MASFTSNGQTLSAFEKEAMTAFQNKDYLNAAYYFSIVVEGGKTQSGILLAYATALENSYDYNKAITVYKQILEAEDADQFPIVNFNLATCYKKTGRYELALENFTHFISNGGDPENQENGYYLKKAKQEIKSCPVSEELLSKIDTQLTIQHLGDSINSPYSEFAPLEVDDKLWFSSLKFPVKAAKKSRKKLRKELIVSKIIRQIDGQLKAVPYLNKNSAFNGNASISEDGQHIYFTRCTGNNYNEIHCAIYYSKKEDDVWSFPDKLPASINLDSSTQTHPRPIEIDDKLYLYFSSNRAGGIGQMDIWRCEIKTHGYEFGTPENLGLSVNSPGNEICPFWDEQRFYFSSDWHEGLGGFDIFYIDQIEEQWQTLTNPGAVYNSTSDDLYFYIAPGDTLAYFCSNRAGSFQLTETTCCHDIYKIDLPKKPQFIPELPPVVFVPKEPEIETEVSQLDTLPDLMEYLPIKLYFHNDEPDSNTTSMFTSKTYNQSYEAYIALINRYKWRYSKGLPPAKMAQARAKVQDFFTNEVIANQILLDSFSKGVLAHLNQGNDIRIAIRGYTSPKAPSVYNDSLAFRRISSIVNHFKTYENGAFLPYIKARNLQFQRLPFGESTSPKGISDSYRDRRNSVYSVEASRERRVELEKVTVEIRKRADSKEKRSP